jgi:hypothetical protein
MKKVAIFILSKLLLVFIMTARLLSKASKFCYDLLESLFREAFISAGIDADDNDIWFVTSVTYICMYTLTLIGVLVWGMVLVQYIFGVPNA